MRTGVLYARIGLQLLTHPKAAEVGEAAMGVYVFMVLYSRANELDGFVPRDVAASCWSTRRRPNLNSVATLIRAGLVEETVGGYRILRYADFNETKEDIAKRRAAVRERVTRYRRVTEPLRNAFVTVSVSDPVSGTDRKRDPEIQIRPVAAVPEPELGSAPEETTVRKVSSSVRYAQAYAAGQVAAGAVGYTPPLSQDDQGALARVILAYWPRARGQELLEAIRSHSEKYRRAVKEPRYESGYRPVAFEKWMNAGMPGLTVRTQAVTMSPAVRKPKTPEPPPEPPPDGFAEMLDKIGK